jgi:hypothetical protein
LSKVAHEFKNPLICIGELVDQVCELINGSVGQILKRIKSMSNYLIILVKDMDFFSRKSSSLEPVILLDRINLVETITLCKDIVGGLLKKVHKESAVNFEVIQDVIYQGTSIQMK